MLNQMRSGTVGKLLSTSTWKDLDRHFHGSVLRLFSAGNNANFVFLFLQIKKNGHGILLTNESGKHRSHPHSRFHLSPIHFVLSSRLLFIIHWYTTIIVIREVMILHCQQNPKPKDKNKSFKSSLIISATWQSFLHAFSFSLFQVWKNWSRIRLHFGKCYCNQLFLILFG